MLGAGVMQMKKKSNVISIVTPVILERVAKMKIAQKAIPKGKDWVEVSYAQKEEAKQLGCRWCPIEKKWYASSWVSSKQVEILLKESAEKKLKRFFKRSLTK